MFRGLSCELNETGLLTGPVKFQCCAYVDMLHVASIKLAESAKLRKGYTLGLPCMLVLMYFYPFQSYSGSGIRRLFKRKASN